MARKTPSQTELSDYLGNQLYDASYDHRLKDVKRLLAKGAPVNWRNSYGWTALHAACFNNRVNVIKILTSQDNIDVNKQTNNNNTPLHWACRYSHLKCVEILCATGQCDLGVVNSDGLTPLEEAVRWGHLNIVEYLITEYNIDVNGGTLPLISLTTDKEIIRYLLQHGASPKNAYSYHRKVLGNVFSKDPLSNPVKVLVIGNNGEGKSTLIQAMEIEPTALTSFKSIFVRPKEVDGVSQRTAGIIPRVYNSGIYGEVQTYDFAGQEAYYSSHAAVVKTTIDTCPPILMLVINLNKNDDAGIASSVSYWLGIIANQCTNMEGKAPLIVVGSHADLVTHKQSISRKEEIVVQAVARYQTVELQRFIPMDNRYSNSSGMKILRRTISSICTHLRSNLEVSLNAHMFLVHLIDKDKIALSLEQVQQEIQEEASQPLSKKQKEVLPFIPTSLQHLVEICVQLNDKGHILFLHNTSSPAKSFIVAQKEKLLGRVNGSIFAPKDFDEHCQLSTSTGVVPRSKLAAHFPDMDPDMIIGFLTHYEFIVPIDDPQVLCLISQQQLDSGESVPDNEEYHFCPGLITLEMLENIFQHLDDHAVHFGWIMHCSQKDQFLDARFLHVLLLRISLSLKLAPMIDQDIPSLQHQCSVWKTGICWKTADGGEVLLEVVDKKKVVVLIQAHHSSVKLFKLRSTVIRKVVDTCSELCSTVVTEEALLPQNSVTHPVLDTTIFSLKSLAESVVGQDMFVISTIGVSKRKLTDFILTEVYADLGVNILVALFNENDPTHDKKLSDRLLSALSNSWNKKPELADIVCMTVSEDCKSVPRMERGLEHVLKKWRDSGEGNCRALRVVLDPLSVFAGKNLLVLAGVDPNTSFSEDLLPQLTLEAEKDTQPLGILDASVESVLTLAALKRKAEVSDSQLDTEIIEHDMYPLAGCFDNVETYLFNLGLNSGQQTDIKDLATRRSTQLAMSEALKLWRSPNPLTATFRALLTILLGLKRGDVAVKVCQYIADNIVSQ